MTGLQCCKMNCPMRSTSSIVLILLWTLCNFRTGFGGNYTFVTSNPSSNRNEGLPIKQIKLQATLAPSENIKNTPRSKLWSPHTTFVYPVDENDGGDIESDRMVGTLGTFTRDQRDETLAAGKPLVETSKKLPIISSIRHYRSRKSFVRTKKVVENNKEGESHPKVGKGEDEEEEDGRKPQGDEPQNNLEPYGTILSSAPRSKGAKNNKMITLKNKVYGVPNFAANSNSFENDLHQEKLVTLKPSSKSGESQSSKPRNNKTRAQTLAGERESTIISSGQEEHQEILKSHTSTKKPRKGKGEKNPKYADWTTTAVPDGVSQQPSRGVVDKKRGDESLHTGAFRKVREKQRLSSRPHEIRDKSDYERNNNYNTEGSGFDDPSPQSQDEEADGKDDSIFPQSSRETDSEEANHGSLWDVLGSGDSLNPDLDEPGLKNPREMDIVTNFLNIVETQHTLGANCTRGTDFNLGEGVVDRYAQERFRLQAELTVNRANMLTRFWKYSPKSLEDEYLLNAMVISLIEFDEDIFAAGNCYDENQYKNYTLFCPFGYREKDGSILVKDLSLDYPYLSNTSEWFYKARKDAERIIKEHNQFSKGIHSFRRNQTNRVEDEILNVTYDDGKWSKPYFDCGGGNIWMITYTIAFFGYTNGTYYFKGTSGIDIDLRRVDIDQCPLPANSTELNIFAKSDKCKKSTTKCVPIKGLGFRRGSYKCECKPGFYFPNVTSVLKHFNGTLLEEEYEKKFTVNETSLYDVEGAFECLPCSFGCDLCVDDRPCVVSLNWLMRAGILILQGAIIAMLPIIGLFTWKYSSHKVVRAASPVLLRFIVLGAFFIYCTIPVMYPSPNVITCTLKMWLREIGFSLAYGALMLKTWRISVIFRVRSAKAIKITDLDLMKRLGIIVAVFTSLLCIRTLVDPPVAIVSYTADELKAWMCITGWWDHSFTIMELSVLVWGIRLCIVVRKAPSEFNESKFISLAIYNEFLLSLFLNISMLFLQSPANPDLLYIIFFCHVQLTMTLLLCLIFGSKAYIVFRGQGKEGADEARVPTSKFITKSRSGVGQTTQKQPSAQNSTGPQSSTPSGSHDQSFNSRLLSEDVQEEFRRLYSQLEELKERNMRLGNRHLVAKIAAMQEAADNVFCTSVQISGGCSSNVKGKQGGLLSDISEEESPSLPKSTDSKLSLVDNRSILVDGQSAGKGNEAKTRRGVQFENLELQDTNLDEVESEEEGMEADATVEESNDMKSDCIEDEDEKERDKGDGGATPSPPDPVESIPMQHLKKRKHKHPRPTSSNPTTSASTTETEKSQNHSGSSSKIVLDLDDKSRFTEEITV